MSEFRGNRQWDYRLHESLHMAFATAEGRPQEDIKRRALSALQGHMKGEPGNDGIEGPLWALVDVSYGSEAVKLACLWFKAATSYPDDDGIRLILCQEAYGKIERALRCYL